MSQTFPSIRIEGGLLGPDILDQLTAGELPGQCAADFGLDGKRNLTDEIAAAFADARALWRVFQHRLERLQADDLATSVTRDAWVIPFLGLLGYDLQYNQRAFNVDGLTFAISHTAKPPSTLSPLSPLPSPLSQTPVHIVGARQELGRVPPSGRPRLAPHSLVQEYLNRTENLWGIVTNGQTLRLLRDCTFVRRQAYVEFDLPGILDEQRFQDFAVLYRLVHRTRLPRTAEDAGDCLLEKYYLHSIEQGGRVRDRLRDGVEECLVRLANGFLRHPANGELRRRISGACSGNERMTPEALYRQLLILVYRFLFLLVSEDRGLLSSDPLYREHYSIGRLRRLLDQRAAFTDHDDLWQSLRVLWLVLTKDQPQPALNNQPMASALGLPVLNGELFAPQDLDNCTISNRDLLEALWRLAWYRENANTPPRRVNYAALDVEELGSVYESLLDFHPAIDLDHAGRPVFRFVAGSERKSTGSYYTPPELVAELIKSALEPVLEDRLKSCSTNAEKEKAILSIRVCDPACGSGHFLLAAARRLGKELARVRTGEDEPAPERVREAVRDCVAHCIYGVDKNPLAVDLCRVALWLEGHTADKPLTFLDHRIRCGDSLVGVFDLAVLADGIPDDAFKPLTGDDKETAKRFKAANRAERRDLQRGQQRLRFDAPQALDDLLQQVRELDRLPDDSPEAIRRKKELYDFIRHSPRAIRLRQACDLWTAAFFQRFPPLSPSGKGAGAEGVITTAVLAEHLSGRPIDPHALGQAQALSAENRFFHWPLEFPEILGHGPSSSTQNRRGFDVVLGNPPFVNAIEGGIDKPVKKFLSVTSNELTGTADLAYHFVARAHRIASPKGTVGLVQPKGFLNAASAAALRDLLTRDRPPRVLYVPEGGAFFEGAAAYVCTVVLGAQQGTCFVADGESPDSAEWQAGTITESNWWRAAQEILGKLSPMSATERATLQDHFEITASMTAGDAYAIKPFIVDDKSSPFLRLVTTGLIDPDRCLWGKVPCRYLKEDYAFPTVEPSSELPRALLRRLAKAKRPKLLIAGLCDRLEAFVDEEAVYIGAVSTFSIFHAKDDVHVLARLCEWLNSAEATEQIRAQLGAASVGGGYMTLKKCSLQQLRIPKSILT